MKKRQSFLLKNKNSQYGASALEVIFAIGLVVAVTPFIYNQVSEMAHVVKDVSVANKITSTKNAVLNYIRMNQLSFNEDSNDIPEETLAEIAPDALKGMVWQQTLANGTIKNIETYLLFNVDDTKYRTASIVKYIGGDAAVVGDDNRAFAKDWAVLLPESWEDVLSSNGNYLVYRIVRDLGGDDKTLYLHRSNLGEGDNLNQMQRPLHMGGNDLLNVGNFIVQNLLNMYQLSSPHIKSNRVDAQKIQFSRGAVKNEGAGTIMFGDLTVYSGIRGFNEISAKNVKVGDGCEDTTGCGVLSTSEMMVTKNANIKDLELRGDITSREDIDCSSSSSVNVKGFDITSSLLSSSNITALLVKLAENKKLKIINKPNWNLEIGGMKYSSVDGVTGTGLNTICLGSVDNWPVGKTCSDKEITKKKKDTSDFFFLIPGTNAFGWTEGHGVLSSYHMF